MNDKPRIWTKDAILELKSKLASGNSIEQIAAQYITTEAAIRKAMSRNGLRVIVSSHKSKKDIVPYAQKQYYSDEQVGKWRKGVKGFNTFCKQILNVTLQDYQLDIAKGMINNKRVVAVTGRQCGKDFLIAVFIVWRCVCFKKQKIMIVNYKQEATKQLYRDVIRYFTSNITLNSYIKTSIMKSTIFTNGNELDTLSAKAKNRGQSAVTHLIINEAYLVPDEAFDDIIPFLARYDGSMYLFSTPSNGCTGKLWECFNDKTFKTFQYTSYENKMLSKGWVDGQRKNYDTLKFEQEYMAIFHESKANFFKKTLINECSGEYYITDRIYPKEHYFCGIDWGDKIHNTVLTIIDKNKDVYKIENIIEWNNVDLTEQTDRILALHNKYDFIKIMAENNNIGTMPCQTLTKALGNIVVQFHSTQDTKTNGYMNLRKLMEDGNIIIPSTHIRLKQELGIFQYKNTPNGGMKLFAPGVKGTDDIIDSFMFAILVASGIKDGDVFSENAEDPYDFNKMTYGDSVGRSYEPSESIDTAYGPVGGINQQDWHNGNF